MKGSSRVIRVDEKGICYSIGKIGNYKKVSYVELEAAFYELQNNNKITRKWYEETFPKQAKSAPCNFTTIGGLLLHFRLAIHNGKGIYSK